MKNILSNQGLTSSEANHITNVIKELVKGLEVKSFPIFSSWIEKKNGATALLDENTRNDKWVEEIKQTGNLYALSAWLKSAIKYKEDLLQKKENEMKSSDGNLNLEQPLKTPLPPNTSFDNFLNELNTKDRTEYLRSEAIAAHIGKFIHNFDRFREASDNFAPTTFQEIGKDLLMIHSKRLYTKEELLEGFFELQKDHREAEQVVNLYKSRHKEWEKDKLDIHSEAVRDITHQNNEITIRNAQKIKDSLDVFEKEKRQYKKEVSAMKIIVPNDLQETLDYVLTFAKR